MRTFDTWNNNFFDCNINMSSYDFTIEDYSQKRVEPKCHICGVNPTLYCITYTDVNGVRGVVEYCRNCISDEDVFEYDAVSVKEAQDYLDENN